MTTHYQWLFFDADGTLFDYDQAEDCALKNTFHDLNLPFIPSNQETYRQINRQIWSDFEHGKIDAVTLRTRRFELLFTALNLDADATAFSARYLVNLSQQAQMIDGAEHVIKTLANKFKLALITNGLSDVQRPRLARSPIGHLFQEIAISEEIGAAKPDPAYFRSVFERISTRFETPDRKHVLVIGDSLTSDISGGLNFGLDTCWFNPTGAPPDPKIRPGFQILRLEELFLFIE